MKPELRVKIAVIDTGIYLNKEIAPFLCREKHIDTTHTTIIDRHGHGTNIASIIASGLDPTKVCILIIKYGDGQYGQGLISSIEYAVSDPKIKYVNISSGGPFSIARERASIQKLLNRGTYVNVAAGNFATNLKKACDYFPACYPFKSEYFHVVASGKNEGLKRSYSNYGSPPVTDWSSNDKVCAGKLDNLKTLCMQGTSQATAVFTNSLIRKDLENNALWFKIKHGAN